jgi:hypothetical protein
MQGTYVFVIILVNFELAWKHDIFPMGLLTNGRDLTHWHTFLLFQLQMTIWTHSIVTLVWFVHKLNSRLGINKSRSCLHDVVYHNWKCVEGLSLDQASGFQTLGKSTPPVFFDMFLGNKCSDVPAWLGLKAAS